MQRIKGINGEILPSIPTADWLPIEHVLQRHRDVWVPIDTYPFLAVDTDRVDTHRGALDAFPVFSTGRLFQNIRPDEGGQRLLSALAGPGLNAGLSPESKVVVEGMANPRAHWMMFLNDPFNVGMHPFAALSTQYVYVDGNDIYQRTFTKLVVIDKRSQPRSTHVDFDPLADLVRYFHDEYISGPRDVRRDVRKLAILLDDIFVENERILAAAESHHRGCAPHEKSFDYIAPTLTRYGRLTHNDGQPRVELSFALLHYEKALREFNDVKAATAVGNTEAAFFHGVYCVVAVAACIEAIANKLVFDQTAAHPDHRDRRRPLEKINEAAAVLAATRGGSFVPLAEGQLGYDALDAVRGLRNAFMHAKERDEEVDPVTLTSSVVAHVDEARCRAYLVHLRQTVSRVYEQLPELTPPIVTKDNVKWMEDDLEVP